MLNHLLKLFVRCRFKLSRASRVSAQIRKSSDRYLAMAKKVNAESGAEVVEVPLMFGVDEDMRLWSLFMLLEHNAIVNRSITALVESLVHDEEPKSIDPKRDVLPAAGAGEEQVEAFRASVEAHLATVAKLGRLRGTRQKRHPVFGMLDAHGWHCMFGAHLQLHMKQAQKIVDGCAGDISSP